MEWLFDNPLAKMPGPWFLCVFASLAAIFFGICRVSRSKLDHTGELPPLPVPSAPNPYQTAYLRGGVSEVKRLATVELLASRQLEETPAKWFRQASLHCADPNSSHSDRPILSGVAQFYREPRSPFDLLSAEVDEVTEQAKHWDRWIEKENLRFSKDATSSHRTVVWTSVWILIAIGAYKLLSAIYHEHYNMFFLIVMIPVVGFAIVTGAALPKFTHRGRRYIEDLQTAFANYRQVPPRDKSLTQNANPSAASLVTDDISLPVIAMGLFGIQALRDSNYNSIYQHCHQAQSTGSSCGSGCGGGGGDGGAGCGGGGGCGGGCGGCGG